MVGPPKTETPSDSPARDAPGIIVPPPLIYVAGLALGFGLHAVLPSTSLPNALEWGLGVFLILASSALAASFVAAFRRARTPVDPYRATTTIVTNGPYRLTRNPGYLGMTLVYAGIAVLTGALRVFIALVPTLVLIDRGVGKREERCVEAKFGDEYRRYQARTRSRL